MREDVLRMSVVMAVAALDAYMHRLVIAALPTHDVLPKGLAKLEVGFGELVEVGDSMVRARRQGRNTRPRHGARAVLQRQLAYKTFQSPDGVSTALHYAGKPKTWEKIAAAYEDEDGKPATTKQVQDQLREIVAWRNYIVHEADYRRLVQPRNNARNDVTAEAAGDAISFIEALIDAIDHA
ncbi:hypothetical protein ACVU7I_03770 [Patulibacter sp. S7RM1-6]